MTEIKAVELWWHDLDGPTPDVVYVEGHIAPEEHEAALAAAADHLTDVAGRNLDDDDFDDWTPPRLGIRRHLWGLFEAPRDDEETDLALVWHVYTSEVPGSRPVTEVIDLDFWAAIKASQAAQRARAEQIGQFIREWHPEAVDVRANGYGGDVRWRMPGLAGDVWWSVREPAAVYVQHRDLDAWGLLYADRKRPALPSGADA